MAQLPAYLQNRTSKALADTISANVGMGSPPYISIMGNRITLIDAVGDQEPVTTTDPKTGMPYLDCCIADAGDHESKIYYSKPFDPSAQSWAPPDCWSDNGIAPSRNAGSPQSAACGTCPKAVWGSATSRVSGKGIPACAKYQKLAIVIPGDEVAFLLRVPPNSLSNLRDYTHKFKGQAFDISDVVTRISFEKDQLGTLNFTAVGMIDEPTFKQREGFLAAKATDLLVGRGDLPREGLTVSPTAPALAAPVAVTPSTATAPLPQAAQQPVTAASPSEQPTGRRRRRTATEAPQQAPFRPETPVVHQGGIAQPAAVTGEITHMLDSLFGNKP